MIMRYLVFAKSHDYNDDDCDNDDDDDDDHHHHNRHFQCTVKDLSIYLCYEKEEKR